MQKILILTAACLVLATIALAGGDRWPGEYHTIDGCKERIIERVEPNNIMITPRPTLPPLIKEEEAAEVKPVRPYIDRRRDVRDPGDTFHRGINTILEIEDVQRELAEGNEGCGCLEMPWNVIENGAVEIAGKPRPPGGMPGPVRSM